MTTTVRTTVSTPPESSGRDRAKYVWLTLALVCVVGARLTLLFLRPEHSTDFDHLYQAAGRLLGGENPYPPGGVWSPLFYPLPAVLFSLPFTVLPLPIARAAVDILVGVAFAFALWKGRGPYALLAMLSGSYIAALYWGQTTPLVVAASLFPALGFLLAVKLNMGTALWLARPSRLAALGAAGFLLLSFLVFPSWPREWVRSILQQNQDLVPLIFRPFGFLLLLAAIRLRTAEGRLLFALALIPQNAMPFELLPLALIPSNAKEMGVYVVGTLLTLAPMAHGLDQGLSPAAMEAANWPWMLVAVYLPMLGIVLRRGRADKVGPRIGKERRRANRLDDEELQVDATQRPGGGVVVKVTHRPTRLSSTESGENREQAERKAHDKLAAILAEMRRARKGA
jgi:hypothetical protein